MYFIVPFLGMLLLLSPVCAEPSAGIVINRHRCMSDSSELEHFVASYDVIAGGTVISVSHESIDLDPSICSRNPQVWRRVELRVEYAVQGSAVGETLTFWVTGGRMPGGTSMMVFPSPPGFKVEERCLVFLSEMLCADAITRLVCTHSEEKQSGHAETIELVETMLEKQSLETIAGKSPEILRGIVESIDHGVPGRRIPSPLPECASTLVVVNIAVKNAIRGGSAERVSIVMHPLFPGALPRFKVGDDVIVFLAPLDDKYRKLSGMRWAKYTVVEGLIEENGQSVDEFVSALGATSE